MFVFIVTGRAHPVRNHSISALFVRTMNVENAKPAHGCHNFLINGLGV